MKLNPNSIRLDGGKHDHPTKGMCVMEVVSLLSDERNFTDHPTCTNVVITRAAQRVNDALSDEDRQRLKALIPRLLRARRTDNDKRVNVRLAIWSAEQVLHLVPVGERRDKAVAAIAAARLWLETGERPAAYAAAAAYAYAAAAAADAYADADAAAAADAAADAYAYAAAAAADAYAAADAAADAYAYAAAAAADADADAAAAAYADAYAAAYADADAAAAADAAADAYAAAAADADASRANARSAEFDPVLHLSDLLDAHEKALVEEGEDPWVPTPWEDAALEWAAEYASA